MGDPLDPILTLNRKINEQAPEMRRLSAYWKGEQPAAYLSKDARDALGGSLTGLSVNFPKLAVKSLAERLTVTGFRTPGEDTTQDSDLWNIWRRNGMEDASAQAHLDALALGRSFVIVWAGTFGVQVTVESPSQVAVLRDPETREVTAALKRWKDDEDNAHAVLYGPEVIKVLEAKARVTDMFPETGWDVVKEIPNPLGVVPVVPLVNRGTLLDMDGVSEMQDVLGLADALNKLSADALVSSEFYARPRRWATGLELAEDEDGEVIQPFSNEANKMWISEDPGTKFGQFDGARLDGYADLMGTVTAQIGALTGLPPHYLGIHGDQPASADAIRSAEASLVARAYSLQRTLGQAWAEVARLMVAVRDGVDPRAVDLETVWASPETRTPAQAADAAVKLKSIGLPLSVLLTETLGYSPAQVERVREAVRSESIDAAGINLEELAQ